jgi:hypothetical protein
MVALMKITTSYNNSYFVNKSDSRFDFVHSIINNYAVAVLGLQITVGFREGRKFSFKLDAPRA